MTKQSASKGVRARWERTPLRVRLVGLLLLLVTVALVLTSIANVTSLNGYLIDQVDDDLRERHDERHAEAMISTAPDLDEHFMVNHVMFIAGPAEVNPVFSPFSEQELPDLSPEMLIENVGTTFTEPSVDGELRWRIYSQVTELFDGGGVEADNETVLAIATPLSEVDTTVARLIWIDLLVGAGVLAGLAAMGVALVRASLYPLKEMQHTATAIAGGDLSQRVPKWDARTEVGQLGAALNVMLGRIESALAAREASEERALASEDRMRRFVADASHELRTPLTTVRGFAELYRQRGHVPPEETADLVRRIEDEATRMGTLVEDLLLLARLDRERPVERGEVDMLSVALDTVAATEVVADGRQIELTTQRGPFVVSGDDLQLRQVLSNLVSNAVRHTGRDASINVRLDVEDGSVLLEVADDGPGMAEDQANRVFERFYRADKARSRQEGSTGLGLAIVSAIVTAHDGSVQVRSTEGEGSVFSVWLPLHVDARDAGDETDAEGD